MSDTEKSFKRWYRIFFIIAIAITAVFIIVVGMLGLRINSDLACGAIYEGASPSATLQNHSHTLDNPGDYVLQEFKTNTSLSLDHEFCFTIQCLSADGAQLEIINQNLSVLEIEYVIQGLDDYCVPLVNLTDHEYLGIRCPTCSNAPNGCVLQEVVAGDNVTHIENDANSLSVTSNPIISYRLTTHRSCKTTLKFFLWTYIWTMVGIFFVMLVMTGFRRFEKFLFEEIEYP